MNLMLSKNLRQSFAFAFLLTLSAATAFGQSVITRPSDVPQPITTASPLVKSTVKSTAPAVAPNAAAVPDVATPSLEPFVSGSRGVLVETVAGNTVMDVASNEHFNPASNVKLITALAVMKQLKPNARFATKLYTDGVFNRATGAIDGNLYVVGNDPSFSYEHAISIAAALNAAGIRQVNGDMIVSAAFTLGYTPSAVRSGVLFYDTLDGTRRSSVATRAWQNHLQQTKQANQNYPSVVVTGLVSSEELPTNLKLIATHESAPVKDILKACLSYSNNFLSERLSDAVGGIYNVERIVEQEAKIDPLELNIASGSGLGINRVTPRAMMKVFRALHNELAKNKMSPTDIMPVSSVDEGTLRNRFPGGSVIGKTGTLPNTDNGVSSLVGQMGTAKGEVLFFVIFNQRGNVNTFRNYQNQLVSYLQNQRGGAVGFQYLPKSFATLFSNNRVVTEKNIN